MTTNSRALIVAMCATFLVTPIVTPTLAQSSETAPANAEARRRAATMGQRGVVFVPRSSTQSNPRRASERPRIHYTGPRMSEGGGAGAAGIAQRGGQGSGGNGGNTGGNGGGDGGGNTNTNGSGGGGSGTGGGGSGAGGGSGTGGGGSGGGVVQPTAPLAPSGLVAADMNDNLRASLAWTDNSSDETGFEIQRERDTGGGTWGETQTISVAAGVTSYIDQPGAGTFRYRVRAINAVGPSEYTLWSQALAASTPPSDPTELTATDMSNRSQVQLAWVDASDNEAGFEITRETQSGSTWGAPVALSASANATGMVDSPGIGVHRYRIRAVNGIGQSNYTAYASVTVREIVPAAPSNLASASAGDASRVNLTWTDASNNETGFEITRETQSGSTWGSAVTINAAANATSIQDAPGIGTHRYRMRSTNSAGSSAYTAYSQVTVAANPPAAPTGLASASANDGSHVNLTWTDASNNETGFELVRETLSGSTWGSAVTRSLAANATSYQDTAAVGTFRYRLRATNAAGASAYTSYSQVTVSSPAPTAPTAPSGVIANDNTDGTATISWSDNSNNETGFEIERSPAFGASRTVSANVQSIDDASGAGMFSYRVRALGAAGTNSGWSSWVTLTVTAPGGGGGGGGTGGGTSAEGFTTFTPGPDSRVVYVSSSDGNNANDGLDPSRPVRTIAAGMNLMRDQMPDFLLLKRGDVWDESFGRWVKRGRSESERMVIGTYGTAAARPLLRTGSNTGFQRVGGSGGPLSLDNIALTGIAFWANTRNGSEWAEGVSWIGAGQNFLVEDCEFKGYHYNLSFEGEGNGVFNVVVRRNVIIDAFSTTAGHSQGIYAFKVTGLVIEENVIDQNGWKRDLSALPTIFNHNLYCHGYVSGLVFRGNISTHASSHGSSVNMDALIENNFYAQNSVNIWVRTAPSTVRNNVIMDAKDIDGANPRGFGMEVGPTWQDEPHPAPGPALVEGNIFANSNCPGEGHCIATNSNQQAQNSTMTFRNNIVYNWNGHPFSINNTNTSRYDVVTVQNNIFVEPTSGRELINFQPPNLDRSRFIFTGNSYYSGASGARLFKIDEVGQTPAQWMAASGETNVSNTPISFVDPNRTAGTYNASLGGQATLDAFLTQARMQSSRNWRPAYTAGAFNDYVRAGFVRN